MTAFLKGDLVGNSLHEAFGLLNEDCHLQVTVQRSCLDEKLVTLHKQLAQHCVCFGSMDMLTPLHVSEAAEPVSALQPQLTPYIL